MNLNDLLFGSRSLNDVPVQMQPALMPPGVLTAPQPDLNQYGDITGPAALSPDVSQYRPDGTVPVSPLEYNPNGPAIGVMRGTQLGPSQEGVPGAAFGYTTPYGGGAVGAPYSGAEILNADGRPVTQGDSQTGSVPSPATPVAAAATTAPAAPVTVPAQPAPVNVASRPVTAAPVSSPAAPAPQPSQVRDGGSDGALKQGKGVLDYMYNQFGGDRLWNSKQGSKELLALGAGILSGSNLMDGLGRGAAAVAAVRSNSEATARDTEQEQWMRQYREKQLQQQAELNRENQLLRKAIVDAQIKGKQDQNTQKNAEAVQTLDYNIDRVNRFLTTLDQKKDVLNSWDNTGAIGAAKQWAQGKTGSNDDVYLLKKDLINWSTNILGELAKNFKPLSNDERRFLEKGIPNEGASVEEWKQFLTEANRHLSAQRRAYGQPSQQPAQTPTQGAPAQSPQPIADPLGFRS